MHIIIPISGIGKRFLDKGYSDPKPLIKIDRKTMIEHVISMFPGEKKFTFICNKDHLKNTRLRQILEHSVPGCSIIEIEPHKKGPVHAVMLAKHRIDDDEQVIVNYCDFFQEWDYDDFKKKVEETQCAGCVPCYTGFHPHLLHKNLYAGVNIDDEGFMVDIQEKHRFTDNPQDTLHSSGTYYFRTGMIIKKYFKELMDKEGHLNGEYYASLPYQLLLRDNLPVYTYNVKRFMQWGTPQDLEEYKFWSESFERFKEGMITKEQILAERKTKTFQQNEKISDEEYRQTFEYWKGFFEKEITLDVLKNAVLKAGKFVLQWCGKTESEKIGIKTRNVVESGADSARTSEKLAMSKIDNECQKIIMNEIIYEADKFSKRIGIIAEESDEEINKIIREKFAHQNKFVSGQLTIMIDPIDGTKNYISASPSSPLHETDKGKQDYWGISLCLFEGTTPVKGTIYYPALGDGILMTVEKGKGVNINGHDVRINKVKTFQKQDFIRVSGALESPGSQLRKYFPDDSQTTAGSFVVTFLSLLKGTSTKAIPELSNIMEYAAYIGKNANIVDIGCCTLAWEEAGGIIVEKKGESINIFDNIEINSGIVRQKDLFIMAPNKKYAQSLLDITKKLQVV